MKRTAVTIVGGCGHVGLPLGIVLAQRGYHVTLMDVDQEKVATVNAGRMPFLETGADDALPQVVGNALFATLDPASLSTADVVITVIGTPVDDHLNPTVKKLYQIVDSVAAQMRDDALLVLRSTVYPGVTKLAYDRVSALNRKIHVAFCPERIAEGKALEELLTLPQIISAFTPEAMVRAREFFRPLTENIIELQPLEAELAKLFSNSWRYLNFAISNQFYILAQTYGLDFHRIRDAVVFDYPRMRSFAGAGFAAGPCLLKDTLQLAAFSGNNFFMGHAAMLINEGLPNFIVNQLRAEELPRKAVAILGMAFKGDSDDARESLSYKLKHLLEVEAREVLCTDPYVNDNNLVPLNVAIARADIIILGAPHSQYRTLKLEGKHVVDVWGFWRTANAREAGSAA